MIISLLFVSVPATTEFYTYCHTLALHDALPSCRGACADRLNLAALDHHQPRLNQRAAAPVKQVRGLEHRGGRRRRRRGGRRLRMGGEGQQQGGCQAGETVAHADPPQGRRKRGVYAYFSPAQEAGKRSEEHTSELQSLMRISYAVFCLKKK